MTPTSDERREIATKLRALAHDNQGLLGAWQMRRVMDEGTRILGTVGLPDCAHVLERYADLIDPTCHVRGYGHPDEFRVVKGCSACHYGWYEDVFGRPYRYCPHCGARVVSGDAQ